MKAPLFVLAAVGAIGFGLTHAPQARAGDLHLDIRVGIPGVLHHHPRVAYRPVVIYHPRAVHRHVHRPRVHARGHRAHRFAHRQEAFLDKRRGHAELHSRALGKIGPASRLHSW